MESDCSAKVLVGSYTYFGKNYCFEDWISNVKNILMSYSNSEFVVVDNSDDKEYAAYLRLKLDVLEKELGRGVFVLHVDDCKGMTSRERQKQSQAVLWKEVKRLGCTYLLIIESDVFPPVDVVSRLLAHKKKVIGGVYSLENDDVKGISSVMGYQLDGEGKTFWQSNENVKKMQELFEKTKTPIKVYSCCLGCVLIHCSVLEMITPDYASFEEGEYYRSVWEYARDKADLCGVGEKPSVKYLIERAKVLCENMMNGSELKIHPDSAFHRNCELYGVNRFIDPSVLCGHRRQNWSEYAKDNKV